MIGADLSKIIELVIKPNLFSVSPCQIRPGCPTAYDWMRSDLALATPSWAWAALPIRLAWGHYHPKLCSLPLSPTSSVYSRQRENPVLQI